MGRDGSGIHHSCEIHPSAITILSASSSSGVAAPSSSIAMRYTRCHPLPSSSSDGGGYELDGGGPAKRSQGQSRPSRQHQGQDHSALLRICGVEIEDNEEQDDKHPPTPPPTHAFVASVTLLPGTMPLRASNSIRTLPSFCATISSRATSTSSG